MNIRHFWQLLLPTAATLILSASAAAVELSKNTNGERLDSGGQATELFRGIDDDLIDVRFIALDAAKANVLLRNNTDAVLHVQLPRAFAAVPVLAQFGRNPGGQNFGAGDGFPGGGNQNAGGASQGVGGGFNAGQGQGFGQQGQGLGQQGFGQGQGMQFGGLMRIPPGKTRKLTATTVCLEHGKPEPHPRLAYRIIPIDQFTDDVRVSKLCDQLGRGEIKQNTAQAVAWHLASGLHWTRLKKINRTESRYLGDTPFFSATELEKAKAVVASLTKHGSDGDSYASDHSTSASE